MERGQSLSVSETRNSALRAKLTFIPEAVARVVHKAIPDLTPNQVTLASAAATATAAYLAERRNSDGNINFKGLRIELAILACAQALDFFDGSLAREIKRVGDREHDLRMGGMWDTLNDRWGAAVMGISRIIVANQRGDRYGEFMASVTTITNPWPSVFRAVGEARGEVFSESGTNILEFFGTHTGRTLLAIPATLYPNMEIEVGGRQLTIQIQKITDTISTVANLLTVFKRVRGGSPMELSAEKLHEVKADAKFRGKGLFFATLGTGAAVLTTHLSLHRKSKNVVI